jgi:hypothetical protein
VRINRRIGGEAVERVYIEALVMGLCIGVAAILLNSWLNDNSWPVRLFALFGVGAALCLLQYGIARLRRE